MCYNQNTGISMTLKKFLVSTTLGYKIYCSSTVFLAYIGQVEYTLFQVKILQGHLAYLVNQEALKPQ